MPHAKLFSVSDILAKHEKTVDPCGVTPHVPHDAGRPVLFGLCMDIRMQLSQRRRRNDTPACESQACLLSPLLKATTLQLVGRGTFVVKEPQVVMKESF